MRRTNQKQGQPKSQNPDNLSSDMAKPLITTIIPTYRRPKLLRRAIESVLNQTYPHLQVCIYDNASGDDTANVVAELSKKDTRVKYHCHAKNIGALNNFNYGLNDVDTEFFSFLGDDDILLPQFYQTALEAFDDFPPAAFSAETTIGMTDDGSISGATLWPAGYYETPEGLLKLIHSKLNWTSVLFRQSVIEDVGDLDPEVGAPSDLDFLLRIAARFPFIFTLAPGAIWLSHKDSSCSNIDSSTIWPGTLKMIRNLTEDERLPLSIRSQAQTIMTRQLKRDLFWAGSNSIQHKNYADAYRSAEILETEFGRNARAKLIFVLAWCCDHLPFAHPMLLIVNRVRKLGRWNARRNLRKQFGHYSTYLNPKESFEKPG